VKKPAGFFRLLARIDTAVFVVDRLSKREKMGAFSPVA
jgi:hypothetical protein